MKTAQAPRGRGQGSEQQRFANFKRVARPKRSAGRVALRQEAAERALLCE